MTRSLIILHYISINTHSNTYIYIYIRIHTYIRTYIHTYIYIYILRIYLYIHIISNVYLSTSLSQQDFHFPPTPPPLQALCHRGQEVAISAGRPVQTCGAAGSQAAPAGHGERCHEGGDPAAWGVQVSYWYDVGSCLNVLLRVKCPHASRCFAGSIFFFPAWFWPQAYKGLFGGWV